MTKPEKLCRTTTLKPGMIDHGSQDESDVSLGASCEDDWDASDDTRESDDLSEMGESYLPSRSSETNGNILESDIPVENSPGHATRSVLQAPNHNDTPSHLASQASSSQWIMIGSGEQNPELPLSQQIYEAFSSTDKTWISDKQINRLIQPGPVTCELERTMGSQHGPNAIKKLAEKVCQDVEVQRPEGGLRIKSFRKIFTILVIIREVPMISRFVEDDVSDLDLPLQRTNDGTGLCRRGDLSKLSHEQGNCCHGWDRFRVDDFERYQYATLAPCFEQSQYNNVPHLVLMNDAALPFVYPDGDDSERHGGYGRVFMVRIHSEYHKFRDLEKAKRGFAIKQIIRGGKKKFDAEVNVLKKFCGSLRHRHVVSVLATYEHRSMFHLIFYRADGNLFDYWKKINPCPEFTYESVKFLAKQCHGIAEGLLRLHRHWTLVKASSIPLFHEEEELKRQSSMSIDTQTSPIKSFHSSLDDLMDRRLIMESRCAKMYQSTSRSRSYWWNEERPSRMVNNPLDEYSELVEKHGRHGDLKPENILWYSDEGNFKICDYGEAELNSRLTKTGMRPELAMSMSYRPPEFDLEPKMIRQSYDIWSLGCVYMEFITWLLGGRELLEKFTKSRLSMDLTWPQAMRTDTFFVILPADDPDYKKEETAEPDGNRRQSIGRGKKRYFAQCKPAVVEVCHCRCTEQHPNDRLSNH